MKLVGAIICFCCPALLSAVEVKTDHFVASLPDGWTIEKSPDSNPIRARSADGAKTFAVFSVDDGGRRPLPETRKLLISWFKTNLGPGWRIVGTPMATKVGNLAGFKLPAATTFGAGSHVGFAASGHNGTYVIHFTSSRNDAAVDPDMKQIVNSFFAFKAAHSHAAPATASPSRPPDLLNIISDHAYLAAGFLVCVVVGVVFWGRYRDNRETIAPITRVIPSRDQNRIK